MSKKLAIPFVRALNEIIQYNVPLPDPFPTPGVKTWRFRFHVHIIYYDELETMFQIRTKRKIKIIKKKRNKIRQMTASNILKINLRKHWVR